MVWAMIVFDLECRSGGHRFEGWFGSSDDFAQQQTSGLLICPVCGSGEVGKAVMAPHVGRKGNQQGRAGRAVEPEESAPAPVSASAPAPVTNAGPAIPPEAVAMFRALAEAQAQALKQSRWVGDKFADTARAMHYGESDAELVHGQASPQEAEALLEEGIGVMPVLFPIVPPGEAN
jgi:hypothetical protein